MQYFIKTYGCQMNWSDAERVETMLKQMGGEKAETEAAADVAVFLACAVREAAVNRLYGNGKKFKARRKHNPRFQAILTGCVSEADKTRLLQVFDEIIDIKDIGSLPKLLKKPYDKNFAPQEEQNYFNISPEHANPFTAYVPIMTGCNNFCSYCIVPHTRGRETSRAPQEILQEISGLLERDYKEIFLLGQNVNSYRPADGTTFPELLRRIDALPGDFWVRFLTSHPKDMTDDLITTVARGTHLTPYIHLALQSGSNRILQAMNRKYTAEHFLGLVQKIRCNLDPVTLTTDIIVGFPGETEEDLAATAQVMHAAKFDMAYINKYSPRDGTASAKLTDSITWEEKKRREKVLNEILRTSARDNNQKYVGKKVQALFLSENEDYYFGRTEEHKDIKLRKNPRVPIRWGEFCNVQVKSAGPWALEGRKKW